MVVTAVGPFVLLHVRVRCRSLKSDNRRHAEVTRVVSSHLCLGDELIFIQCLCD
jgi:hypothetical protein